MDVNGTEYPIYCSTKLKHYNWRMNIVCHIISPVESEPTKSALHFLKETTERRGGTGILDCRIIGNAMVSNEVTE